MYCFFVVLLITFQTKQEGDEHPGAVGRLVPNAIAKYVPITGEEVKPGRAEGELWVKGPNVFLGYLNNPAATKESFSEDGYYKTGDVGYEDDYGNFVITDRIKELIKYNGFQVPPAELEALLLGHPAVADVAVVGIPSGKAGSELPRAYVKVKEDGQANQKTADDIVDFVRGKVAAYKQLRGGVHFVDAIPRNPAGKILRRELKKLYANKL
jgi:acyl-CoA synthetase (AMP-forming)/AMP-acid ligase II